MTAEKVIESRSGELVTLLGELKGLHEELLRFIEQKLEAMRRADTEKLNACLSREQFLAQRIAEREGLRQQLVQLIGRAMDLTQDQTERLTVKDIADRVAEPRRGQLLGLAAGIRQTLQAIHARNQVAALVTDEMLKHFRQVYTVMAKSGPSTGRYSPAGTPATDRPRQVFEAVG